MRIINLKIYKLQKILENKTSLINEKTLSKQILDSLEYNNFHGAVPIVKIAKKFGIGSFKEQVENENIVGKLYVDGNTKSIYDYDKVILINPNNHLYYNRIIIATLLGYYLLDVMKHKNYQDKNILLCNEIIHEDVYTIHEEFILNMMLPDEIFLEQLNIANRECSGFLKSIYLSRYFEVPPECIKRKIRSLG